MHKSAAPLAPMRAIIFDMDGTLYSNAKLAKRYDASMYAFVAEKKGVSTLRAKALFHQAYAAWHRKLGRQPSKLNVLARLGMSDVEWARKQGRQIRLERYLRPDPSLRRALEQLRKYFLLAVVTNNHRENLDRTLRVLGVADCFDRTMTLSEHRRFKPSSWLYQTMARQLGVDPKDCLSVGDRYDLDLEPAAAIGMQTLLVNQMQDVYALPAACRPCLAQVLPIQKQAGAREAVHTAVRTLRQGRLVILPTDTVYGLAAKLAGPAVELIYRTKGREADSPLLLLLADSRQAGRYAEIPAAARELMKKYWPGALTLILPIKKNSGWGKIVHSQRTIGLRVPAQAVAREVIRQVGGALAVTSANISGEPAPVIVRKISKQVLAFSDYVLDAGKCPVGVSSTIVQVSGRRLKILRQGSLELEQLNAQAPEQLRN